jgi:hypothetical protein
MKRHLLRALVLLGGWQAAAGQATAQYPSSLYPTGPATAQYPQYPYPSAFTYGQQPYAPLGYQPGGAYGTPARPPVSPYLNILQNNRSPAVNYYNFTRPALQNQQFLQQQQSGGALGVPPSEPFGLATTDVQYAPPAQAPQLRMPSPTGHPTTFLYQGGYFNSFGTIGAPIAGGGQIGTAPRTSAPGIPRR